MVATASLPRMPEVTNVLALAAGIEFLSQQRGTFPVSPKAHALQVLLPAHSPWHSSGSPLGTSKLAKSLPSRSTAPFINEKPAGVTAATFSPDVQQLLGCASGTAFFSQQRGDGPWLVLGAT